MADVPQTSETLLRDLAGDTQHPRWSEFVARYRPMMEAYVSARFPAVDVDDVIQETLIALVQKLPNYRYVPEKVGHFHNYLTGILRHKALRICKNRQRKSVALEEWCHDSCENESLVRVEREWRESVYEIALEQVLADDSIQVRTRQVFVRTAVNGESPEEVARSFGVTRNAVDQMKSRMIGKMQEIIAQLESVDVEIG